MKMPLRTSDRVAIDSVESTEAVVGAATALSQPQDQIRRLDTRIDTLKRLTLPHIKAFKEKLDALDAEIAKLEDGPSESEGLEGWRHAVTRLDERIDTLKKLTLPPIAELKKKARPVRPPMYDQLRLFTYLIDKEATLDQKKWFIERQFYRALGYFPNIDKPKSFNEKTQWYKLYYKDPLITKCIDKYLFKEHVAQRLGERYVVPLLGVWDRGADVDFETLPNEFAIKSNWGSGSRHVLLVRNKADMNIDETRLKISNWVQPWENVYYHTFDWGYKDIPPKILAEKFITNKRLEYKFFCFGGEPAYFYVASDSSPGSRNTHNYYDMDWNLLPFTRHAKNAEFEIARPDNFDEMLQIARTLSKGFPHVRVDLCDTTTGLLVEEMTFYVGSGTGRFSPTEWDFKFGERFDLPKLGEA